MFCTKCGVQIEDDSLFCPKCGFQTARSEASDKERQTYTGTKWQNNIPVSGSESNRNLLCGLAYLPILFWLPLVALPGSDIGKKSANQGLLLLILSVIQGGISRVLRPLFWHLDFFPFSIILFLLKMLIAMLGLFTFVVMIIGLVKGCRGEYYEIPLIGKIRLIQ